MLPRELVAPLLMTRNGFPRVDWNPAAATIGNDGVLTDDVVARLVDGGSLNVLGL